MQSHQPATIPPTTSRRPRRRLAAFTALVAITAGLLVADAARTPQPADARFRWNFAIGGAASQSSTKYGAVAGRAVDGSSTGRWDLNSVTHTYREWQPWWDLRMKTAADIRVVRIHNRTDCCRARLERFWLFVSDRPFPNTKNPAVLKNAPNVYAVLVNMVPARNYFEITVDYKNARYFRVQLPDEGTLSLGEFMAVGNSPY